MYKIFERTFTKEIDCAASVALWNYWDHEHLNVVHKNFTDVNVLYESSEMVILLLSYKLPIFSFLKSTTMSTYFMKGKYHFSDYQKLSFGIPFVSTINITELGPDRCSITMNYKYYLNWWKYLVFSPILKLMSKKWNEDFWQEDVSLKERRQKVLRWGFKDFVGLPHNLKDRQYDGELTQSLPVPRPKGNPLDRLRF